MADISSTRHKDITATANYKSRRLGKFLQRRFLSFDVTLIVGRILTFRPPGAMFSIKDN